MLLKKSKEYYPCKECYPCTEDQEWYSYIHIYENMPLCQLKSNLFYYEEKLARMEADAPGKLVTLFFAYVALVVSFVSLNAKLISINDFIKIFIFVLFCVGLFAYYGWKLIHFEVKHRRVHLHIVCIKQIIKYKENALKRAFQNHKKIVLKRYTPISHGHCALNSVSSKRK